MTDPDFYMAPDDATPPLEVRRCYVRQVLRSNKGEGFLLVRLEPPLGPARAPLEEVILISSDPGQALVPIERWPVPVYVDEILNQSVRDTGIVLPQDVRIVWWAWLYASLADAQRAIQGLEDAERRL
jgi:hypothetical protein